MTMFPSVVLRSLLVTENRLLRSLSMTENRLPLSVRWLFDWLHLLSQ